MTHLMARGGARVSPPRLRERVRVGGCLLKGGPRDLQCVSFRRDEAVTEVARIKAEQIGIPLGPGPGVQVAC